MGIIYSMSTENQNQNWRSNHSKEFQESLEQLQDLLASQEAETNTPKQDIEPLNADDWEEVATELEQYFNNHSEED